MAHYVWLIRRGEIAIAVDTGFNARSGAKRGRRLLRSPADGLRALGVAPETVATLIVTQLHCDHIGNAELFPAEQTRIVQLLVERADLHEDGIELRLRAEGLVSLAGELHSTRPPAKQAA